VSSLPGRALGTALIYYSRRVRVEVDPFIPLDDARAALAATGAEIGPVQRPLGGEGIVGLVVWEDSVGEEELARLPDLRVVVTASVGYDHIDVEAARRRGVVACNVPDYCVEEMADSTLALLLALLRGVVALDREVRSGGWDYRAAGPLRSLAGTRLGIIGLGRIGAAVARNARALGMDVAVSDPFVTEEAIREAGARPAGLEELLAQSDAVTLHVPLTPATVGLLGRAEIARMPRGSYLVNTARARLVDLDALVDALASGHLAGAALDVLEVEPPSRAHPAPQAPTLIVTPHAAFYSEQAEAELMRRSLVAVRDVLEGRVPASAL
jgi:D-3-phosphoglycerate dehydrogenase / 2-oxoglutarate reductase